MALERLVPLLRGCEAAYLDLGSNRGLKIEQLLEARPLCPTNARQPPVHPTTHVPTHPSRPCTHPPIHSVCCRGELEGSSGSFRQRTEAQAHCHVYSALNRTRRMRRTCAPWRTLSVLLAGG